MQIVAPAGSYASLRAAVTAGADAVYLGASNFGARAKAENFDKEALKSAIEYAHTFGTRVFITLNTLIKDGEMQDALDVARYAYKCNADAAIVQDLRFIEQLKKNLPDFPLHASTQMGIHNAEGAKVLYDLGITRAVLSRETLPQDIQKIKDIGLEIEFFVQGALCICFSGNCYFSSLASSYSGNRGKCMQLCRKPYIFNGKRGYYLSAKDICMYNELKRLEELGVDAIKIEGRMRSEEYVAQAVRVYKSSMPYDKALNALKSVYNRGDYCTAYLHGGAQFNVIYAKSQANIGKYIGKIDKTQGKKVFVKGFTPHKDDGFKIMRGGIEVAGANAKDGGITTSAECRVGDDLRRTFDGALSDELKAIKRLLDISVSVDMRAHTNPVAIVSASGVSVTVQGEFKPQPAVSRELTADDIKRSFDKTAEYPFRPNVSVSIESGLFMPVSAINDFRRAAYDAFYNKLISSYNLKRVILPYNGLRYNKFVGTGKMLMVEDEAQLNSDIVSRIDYLVLNPKDYSNFTIPKIDKPILLNLPVVARGDDIEIVRRAVAREGIFGAVSNNLYSLSITDKPILLGTGHNIIGKTNLPHITSFEADATDPDAWVYAFGYAPVMTLCHCPYDKCIGCDGNETLQDENGRVFKYRRYKLSTCYRQLLNCVPHDLISGARGYKNIFYDCTEFSAHEIGDILRGNFSPSAFTRGNLNKGLK